MTPRARLAAMLGLMLLVAGCATSEVKRLAEAHDEHVYARWTLPGDPVVYLTRNCPALDGAEPWGYEIDLNVPNRSECVDVAGTRDPADVEFWSFELHRVKRQAIYGVIPLSPWYKSSDTRTVGVVGPRDRCEAVRLKMDRKPKGVAGDESMRMTEGPCEGPKYFRQPPTTAAEARP